MSRAANLATRAMLFGNRLPQMLRDHQKYSRIVPKKYYNLLTPMTIKWIRDRQTTLISKEKTTKLEEVAHILSFPGWANKVNLDIKNLEQMPHSLWNRKILLLSLVASLCALTLHQADLQGQEIMETSESHHKEIAENESTILKEEKELKKQKNLANEIVLQRREFVERKDRILRKEEEFSQKKILFNIEKQKIVASKREFEAKREALFQKIYALEIEKNMPNFVFKKSEALTLNEKVAQDLRASKLSPSLKGEAEDLISANNTIQILQQQLQYVVTNYESQIDQAIQRVDSLNEEYKEFSQKKLREQTIKLKQMHQKEYSEKKNEHSEGI